MTAELTPFKSAAATAADSTGKSWFPVGLLAVGFVGCGVILKSHMAAVGFLFLGHMIFFLTTFWLLATPGPLKAGEARPPAPASLRSLPAWALLAGVAFAALSCCALAGRAPGWFPMMK